MGHTLTISEEAYQAIAAAAAASGQTPEALIEGWAQLIQPPDPATQPQYYETDDWFRHLGASEEMIRKAKALADEMFADADS